MKLTFVAVSNKLPAWLGEVVQDYKKKISYWLPIEINILKTVALDRGAQDKKKKQESELIYKAIKDEDFVIACDEKGRDFTSKDFSQRLEKIFNAGKKRIVIIIGGAYGLEDNVLKRADLRLSLSRFTLNHHMALAVMCEQTYRAMTILKGIKYHND